jgi:hypothetical protein
MNGNPSGVSGQKAIEIMSTTNEATYTLTADQAAVLSNALLATFDAGSKRAEIVAEIEREAATMPNKALPVFGAAAALLGSLPKGTRADARIAIVSWLESIAVGEPIGVQVDGAQAVADAASDATPEPTPEPLPPPPDASTVPAQAAAEPSSDAPPPAEGPTGETAEDAALRAALAEAPKEIVDPYRDVVWFRADFGRLGVGRDITDRVRVTSLDAQSQASDPAAGGKGKKSTKTTVKLLSDCPEHASIEAADNSFRLAIRSVALPSQLRGIYPVPIALMDRVETLAADYITSTRPALVQALDNVYDQAVIDDRDVVERLDPMTGIRELPGVWRASDYVPRAVAVASYTASTTWVDLTGSKRLDTAMAARNAEAMKVQQREAWAEIRAAARVQAGSMLDELTALLRPGEDGKRKSFRDVRIASLQGWLKDLAAKDVTNDVALAKVADQIRATLDGVADWQAVRESGTARDAIAAKLDTAREALRTLGVGKAGPRKFKARAPVAEGNGSGSTPPAAG